MRLGFTQESDFRQERDFGQKISATLEFIGAHFRPLGRVLLYLVVPAVLLQSIVAVLLQLTLSGTAAGSLQDQSFGLGGIGLPGDFWNALLSSPTYWIGTTLRTAIFTLLILSVYGYVNQCLQPRPAGTEVTVAEVWAVVRRHFIIAFFSVWGLGIIIGLGFVMLMVPGIYLGVALSLFFIVQMVENTGFGETISRCLRLTRGKWWSTFGVIFIMGAIVYVIILGVGFTVTMLSGGWRMLLQASQMRSPLFTALLASFNTLVLLMLYPPLLLVVAFQYFNLVERHDGVGLRRLVDALGQTPAPQARNAMYQPDEEGEY